MVTKWLCQKQRTPCPYKFNIIDISEDINYLTDDIKKFLATELLINFVHPEWLQRVYSKEPKEMLVEFLEKEQFPDPEAPFSPRQSMWGEVLTSVVFQKLKNCIVPIKKLRFKECKNKAMRGKADVVAARIINDKLVIYFGEAKSKIQYIKPSIRKDGQIKLNDKELAEKAYLGLVENNVNKPEIISYISQKLFYEDEFDYANHFDSAVKDPSSYDKAFEIFLIFEKTCWEEEILDHLSRIDISLPNFIVNVILINKFKELIDLSYSLAIEVGKEIVYG